MAVAHPSINSVFSVFGGSLGCNSALHTSTITVNPLPIVNINPNPLKLCIGETSSLSALGNGETFQWYPFYGLNTYTNQHVITHINQNQNYTVVATLNNCSNTAVGMVSLMPLPIPQITALNDEVCLLEDIKLNGTGGLVYEWKSPANTSHFSHNLVLGASHMGLAGTYTLKVVDANTCAGYTMHPVIIHDLPQGYLIPKRTEFCVPYCNSFTFVPNAVASIIESGPWTLNTLLFTGNTFTSCFSKTGQFEIKGPIKDEFGCENSIQLKVIGRPKPVAEFYVTPEKPVEGLDEVRFVNVTSNIIGYSWQSSGPEAEQSSLQDLWSQFESEEESPSYLFNEAGVYGLLLIVKNEFNCIDTVMKTITVESDFAAYIPNAFTPNGDGLNDTFYPVMRGVKKFELQIFDRWGEIIFSSNSTEHVWDGTFKGQECKQDAYNYKLVLLNVRGEEKVYTGTVLLYH
jgi:gliding motility-associated-like protein